MTQPRDSTMPITGGASGISRHMGLLSLQRGTKQLIIRDINRHNLQQTTAAITAKEYPVLPYEVDVADTATVAEGLFDLVVGRGFKAYSTMDHFTGRLAAKEAPPHKTTLNL